ncbi:MAG: TorF family putative porin [Erythrobacter sp.]
MLTSIRGLMAASLVTGMAFAATPALAEESSEENLSEMKLVLSEAVTEADIDRAIQDIETDAANSVGGDGGFEISANVALASEYRFRGVDLSGGNLAIQGGVDFSHTSGFYIGTWASNLDEDTVGFGSTELDVYAGFGGDIGEGLSYDIGGIYYLYPDAASGAATDYFEVYGSLGFGLGPAELTAGVAYAPDQQSLGSTDNLYLYTDIGFGIPETSLTVTGHLGYTDGFLTFTDDGKAFDWSIGVEAALAGPLSVGVSYVGVEGDGLIDPGGVFTDDAIVFTLSASI